MNPSTIKTLGLAWIGIFLLIAGMYPLLVFDLLPNLFVVPSPPAAAALAPLWSLMVAVGAFLIFVEAYRIIQRPSIQPA